MLETSSENQQREKEFCPECRSINLLRDYETGEIVCGDCGFVLAAQIADRGPEWRAFNIDEQAKRTRVGSPLTYRMHDKGLSTVIDYRNYDARKRPIRMEDINRLRKLQKRISAYGSEMGLAASLQDISKVCNHLALPKNVVETASLIYTKAWKEGIVRGREAKYVTRAAVYLACRKCGVPRTLEEIAEVANDPRQSKETKKDIFRCYRALTLALDYEVPVQKPEDYLSKLLEMLDMRGITGETVYKVLRAVREARLTSGKGPTGMAAAACYAASLVTGERKSQREIAELADITEVTIRNRYRELSKKLMFEVYL